MKTVLILDSNQRSALAVTRSLGQRNISIITADETPTSLAGNSRYSQQYIQYPSALQKSHLFIQKIANICQQLKIDFIYPMTEITTILLLKNKTILPDVILPFTDIDSINTLSNKCQLMQLAESLQIPIPNSRHIQSTNRLTIDFNRLTYPLVLKPGMSWIETDGNWLHTTVRFADNAKQARDIINSDPSFQSHPYMLQNYISGHGEGVFALYNQGKAIAFFAHKRLREKPPLGGVSVLSESVAVNSTLESYARQLLDHVGWHGVAMVEFRVTPDGKPYLMEINTRFWGSLQLAIDAGADFPWLLYQTCIKDNSQTSNEHQIPVINHYKIGQRLRWILGDFDSLYLVLRGKGFSLREKVSAIVNFLTPHPFITRHEVNRLSDFKPFLWELKQYIKDLKG